MRLRLLYVILIAVLLHGTYHYGFNKGSEDEVYFIKSALIPLCDLLSKDKEKMINCILTGL
jgi:hypothetical protein